MEYFGGIETGGTKVNCMVASDPEHVLAYERIPTTTPDKTIGDILAFFHRFQAEHEVKLETIGLGSFGPVDLQPTSPTYGYITSTPKPGWQNAPLLPAIAKELDIPFIFDNDVNAAAIGEHLWGAAQDSQTFMYITIGTGVGGGIFTNGAAIHGLVHPEVGHICMPHDLQKDPFPGWCPFHADCFEGLTAGPAMEKRWNTRAENLAPDHPAWELEAWYIASALRTFICCYSPERIILGGGVMQQETLFPMVRKFTLELLNGYVQSPAILESIDSYIVPPGLGDKAGIYGCIAMARLFKEGKI
ncbi:MAG: ROK family protein [Anaerolineaceae bacterium]|nr:ROK family protein [Anaerolineaceae bacterium]